MRGKVLHRLKLNVHPLVDYLVVQSRRNNGGDRGEARSQGQGSFITGEVAAAAVGGGVGGQAGATERTARTWHITKYDII